jgi:hypothetical protein
LYQQDPHCGYCRRPLACPDAGVLDHATPRSRGGGDRPSNAILACPQCDRAKGRRTISEWKADLLAGLFAIGSENFTEAIPDRLDEKPNALAALGSDPIGNSTRNTSGET